MSTSTIVSNISKPLKEREAAEIIGFSVHWLRRKRWSGDGPKYLKLGASVKSGVRYRYQDLMDYMSEHEATSTSQMMQRGAA